MKMEISKINIEQRAEYIVPMRLITSSSSNLLIKTDERTVTEDMLLKRDMPMVNENMPLRRDMTTLTKEAIGKAMIMGNALIRWKIRAGKRISGNAPIDPLIWTDMHTMKWWPGLLAIFTSYCIAPILTSLFFIAISWKEYELYPSKWWQCGVYCSALWLTSIQWFGIQCIQIKVRSKKEYATFVPAKLKAFFLYLSSAIFAFMVWAFCWWVWDYQLIHPLGQSYAVALAGILGTAVFQSKFLVPRHIDFKKDIFWLCLLGGTMVPVALFFSLGCLISYIWSDGWTPVLASFVISRFVVDMMMRKIITFTNSALLEPIFIHISALCNGIFLIYSISYNGPKSFGGIIFAAMNNSVLMVYYYVVITSSLEFQLGFENWKITFGAWYNKRKCVYPIMSSDERKQAVELRSKLVYMVILDMASQLILPWWLPLQLGLILFNTPADTSMVTFGFATTRESFNHRFNTALMLNGVDIVLMTGLTYFVRKKYPLFDPLRILHLIFEKFGFLPISGIMFILISIICFFIKDCGIDPDIVWEKLASF